MNDPAGYANPIKALRPNVAAKRNSDDPRFASLRPEHINDLRAAHKTIGFYSHSILHTADLAERFNHARHVLEGDIRRPRLLPFVEQTGPEPARAFQRVPGDLADPRRSGAGNLSDEMLGLGLKKRPIWRCTVQ